MSCALIYLSRRGEIPTEVGCDIPGIEERAARSPILPCTGLGLSCLLCYLRSGELLPPLFTLTLRNLKDRSGRFIFCDTIRHDRLPDRAPAFTGNPALRCPDFPLNFSTKRTPTPRNRHPQAESPKRPGQARSHSSPIIHPPNTLNLPHTKGGPNFDLYFNQPHTAHV